jgi:hypothetical protein
LNLLTQNDSPPLIEQLSLFELPDPSSISGVMNELLLLLHICKCTKLGLARQRLWEYLIIYSHSRWRANNRETIDVCARVDFRGRVPVRYDICSTLHLVSHEIVHFRGRVPARYDICRTLHLVSHDFVHFRGRVPARYDICRTLHLVSHGHPGQQLSLLAISFPR